MLSDRGARSRAQRVRPPAASEQLEALLGYPWPFSGRPHKHDLSTWTVTDDWPHPVPVTGAEIECSSKGSAICSTSCLVPAADDPGVESTLKSALQ